MVCDGDRAIEEAELRMGVETSAGWLAAKAG
jgi:hypothetical protein